MRPKKKIARSLLFTATLLGVLLLALPGAAQALEAYVPSDFGDTTDLVARLETFGWTVTTTYTLDLESDDPYTAFDVIWIVSDASEYLRDYLRDTRLTSFTKNGGVLVVVDVSGDGAGIDRAPDGVDAMGLPEEGSGSVTIAAPDHPLITGEGIGGLTLTDADLDPESTGGLGYLDNAPDGSTVIAQNASGPSVLEYTAGEGHVIVCALRNPSSACTDNIVLYAESLAQ